MGNVQETGSVELVNVTVTLINLCQKHPLRINLYVKEAVEASKSYWDTQLHAREISPICWKSELNHSSSRPLSPYLDGLIWVIETKFRSTGDLYDSICRHKELDMLLRCVV